MEMFEEDIVDKALKKMMPPKVDTEAKVKELLE